MAPPSKKKKKQQNIRSTAYFRRNEQVDVEPSPEPGGWGRAVIARLTRSTEQTEGRTVFLQERGMLGSYNYMYTVVLKMKTGKGKDLQGIC